MNGLLAGSAPAAPAKLDGAASTATSQRSIAFDVPASSTHEGEEDPRDEGHRPSRPPAPMFSTVAKRRYFNVEAETLSHKRRIVLVVGTAIFIQCALFGFFLRYFSLKRGDTRMTAGIVFGYSSLKTALIHDGTYAELCDASSSSGSGVCVEQSLRLNLMFTLASSLLSVRHEHD